MAPMMTCPRCQTRYRLPENAAGRKVKCQKCDELFVVPAQDTEDVPPAGIADKPGPPPVRKIEPEERERRRPRDDDDDRPRRSRPRTDDDDDLRSRRRRPRDDDDDDDRPRRRPSDDDDDEDRPRRRRRRPAEPAGWSGKTIAVVIGSICLAGFMACGLGVWRIYQVAADAKKVIDDAIVQGQKQALFMPANAKIPVEGPGIKVVFGAAGAYSSANTLALNDPLFAGKRYKLYLVPLEKGKVYRIDLVSGEFDAYLGLLRPDDTVAANDDDSGGNLNAAITYTAEESATYKIIATSFVVGQGNFTLTIRPAVGGMPNLPTFPVGNKGTQIALGPDGAAAVNGTLGRTDPQTNGKHHKLFFVTLEKGKSYQIDQESMQFDSYLYLLDAKNTILVQDDDGAGKDLDARIRFIAPETGIYKIVATSLNGDEEGLFRLTVRRAGP